MQLTTCISRAHAIVATRYMVQHHDTAFWCLLIHMFACPAAEGELTWMTRDTSG